MSEIVHTALNLYVNGYFVAGVKDIATAEEATVSKNAMNSNPSLKQNLHSAVIGTKRADLLAEANTTPREDNSYTEDSVTLSDANEAQDINSSNYNNLAVYRKLDSALINRVKLNNLHALAGVPNPISIVTAIESMYDDIRLQGKMTDDPAPLIALLKNITKE